MDWNAWVDARIDLLMLLSSSALVVSYHLFLYYKGRGRRHTFRGVISRSRAAWVRSVMEEKRDVLAVQTFRNSTMASTFLASTAVFLVTGVLTLSAQGEKLEAIWNALDVGGSSHQLWMLKILVMLIDLFSAFLSFTMCIRLFHHVGYMINVPLSGEYGRIQPEIVIQQLDRAGAFYWFGMRAYFILVPLVMWLFGPHFMFGSTCVLLALLFRLDHVQSAEECDSVTSSERAVPLPK